MKVFCTNENDDDDDDDTKEVNGMVGKKKNEKRLFLTNHGIAKRHIKKFIYESYSSFLCACIHTSTIGLKFSTFVQNCQKWILSWTLNKNKRNNHAV